MTSLSIKAASGLDLITCNYIIVCEVLASCQFMQNMLLLGAPAGVMTTQTDMQTLQLHVMQRHVMKPHLMQAVISMKSWLQESSTEADELTSILS